MSYSRRRRAAAAATLALCLAGTACGGSGSATSSSNQPSTLLIAVNVPQSSDPYVSGYITRGADLAVKEANQKGGVQVAGVAYQLTMKVYDDGGDPQRAAANVDNAIHDGAVGIIEDGIGAETSSSRSRAAGVPEIVIANGRADLMDAQVRPSLFRLGIANDGAARILGVYVAGRAKSVAVIHDDSDDGRDGSKQMVNTLVTAGITAPEVEAPAASPTVDAALRTALAGQPAALVLWGSDTFIARVVNAAHTAGVAVPLFAGPSAESPAVRAVAGSAGSEGLTFITSRTYSEADTTSFGMFEHRLAAAEGGPIDAGIKNAAGEEIRQPADRDFFAYDAVNVLLAVMQKAGSAQPSPSLLTAMTQARTKSANGDTRGFNPDNHEGVSDDDQYIAVIHDMVFNPVKDEKLSATLTPVDQILAHFH